MSAPLLSSKTLIAATLAAALTGCAQLPSLEGRTPSAAIDDVTGTTLDRAFAADAAAHPGLSGFQALPDPLEAFATRVLLATAAEKSLDAQYYIWHDDTVGMLLFEALWRAAERGVHVRLLLDDLNTRGLDATLATLDAHVNIEVRLYNPFPHRGSRWLDFAGDFARVNRRMHNKSFTVDKRASVVGGRNIGDEYFGAGDGMLFADLDVLAVGSVLPQISAQFDRYWNSASAYPASLLLARPAPDAAEMLQTRFPATLTGAEAAAYIDAVRRTHLVRDVSEGKLSLEWTRSTLVFDDPAKTLDPAAGDDVLLLPQLLRSLGRPESSLDMVSPYFVPGKLGTQALVAEAQRGVRVRILTNSLAASDVSVVHAGYAKRREALLRAGVLLFELKPTASIVPRDERSGSAATGSGSSSGLHTKTFAVDRQRIFVGSFNFDPRSALLNTEMGLVIDSPQLATQLGELFDIQVPAQAYEVRLAADGSGLEWIERTADGTKVHRIEPETGWWQRTGVQLMSVLPIEWLL